MLTENITHMAGSQPCIAEATCIVFRIRFVRLDLLDFNSCSIITSCVILVKYLTTLIFSIFITK